MNEKLRFADARKNNWQVEKIFRRFVAHNARLKKRRAVIERKLAKLDKQRRELLDKNKQALLNEKPWFVELLEPLAKIMVKVIEARTGVPRTYELLGPFGLSSEVSIHFYKVGVPENKKLDGDNCLSITFRPGDLDAGELFVVDYTKDTHEFPDGSIGQINGLNHPSVPVKHQVDFLLGFVR